MNIFRIIGDLLHLASILLLLWKIRVHQSCAGLCWSKNACYLSQRHLSDLPSPSFLGVSLKSQVLYVIIFTTRYLDIFWNTLSLYNTVMKLIFLASSYAIVYLMQYKYRHSYDKEHDSFRILFLIIPSFVLALFIHSETTISEVGPLSGLKSREINSLLAQILWTFSIYLEAVAILPQLFLLQRTGEVETLTSHYIVALGGYRFFYILNWIYRIATEPSYDSSNWIVWISGLVQTALYVDFFYYYVLRYHHPFLFLLLRSGCVGSGVMLWHACVAAIVYVCSFAF